MKVRVVKLQIREIDNPTGKSVKFNFSEMYILALKSGGPQGIRGESIFDRLEVIGEINDAVEKDRGVVHLTEENWKVLKDCAMEMPFTTVDKCFAEWLKNVKDAPKEEIDTTAAEETGEVS